jgi:membrane fusion protein (multidrug efflux system)
MSKNKKKFGKIIAVLLAFLLIAVGYIVMHLNEESTDDASIDGRSVMISPKVMGYVKTLNVNDNQAVKAGDTLLEIDPADYVLRRDNAKAALDAAMAQEISAEATFEKTHSDLKRMQRLSQQARSQEQLEQSTADEKAAQASIDQVKAQVRQAESNLAQAEKDLADTKIIAPMDGYITKRGVERGDYVQPGQQLLTLVGKDIWVVANFKETQLKNMHEGNLVDIKIDAFPNVKLKGKIDSIQMGTGVYFSAFPPQNATGNYVKIIQRVPVKITFTEAPDPKLHLGLGMSVVPVVHIGTAEAVHE